MQALVLEGTTEDSVRLSDDVELVGALEPRQCRVEIRAATGPPPSSPTRFPFYL